MEPKQKVYLAGKVTGEDYQQCFEKFELYETLIKMGGYEVINPMRIVKNGTHWQDAMDILEPHFKNCHFAFFMGDWTQSRGARIEMDWAKQYEKPVIFDSELDGFVQNAPVPCF